MERWREDREDKIEKIERGRERWREEKRGRELQRKTNNNRLIRPHYRLFVMKDSKVLVQCCLT